jgi:outer membrane protein TolC
VLGVQSGPGSNSQGAKVKKLLLSVILATAPAVGLWAQEAQSPAAADLGAILREAEANNPAIRAAAARLSAAQRVPSQASAPPDPEVSIAYLNDGTSQFTLGKTEFSALSLTWTQEVPYPGKLGRMGEVAARESDRVGRDLERVRLEVTAAVKAAYADLYRLDQTALTLRETKSVLESLAEAARRRYEVGEGIQESVLKAQTEILRLEAELARVAQDRRTAEVWLNATVGRSTDTPIGPATSIPEAAVPVDMEGLADRAVASSPAVAALQAAVLREEAGVHVARLNLKPDFLWSASYQNRDGLDPMVAGMFGVRLPIFRERKQSQALLQRESELLAARQDLTELQLQTMASVRDLTSRFQRADRLRTLFDQGVIPQARAALESAQTAYGVGRLGFLDILNDLTTLLNARIDLVTQEADRLQALAALEPLLVQELIHVQGGSPDQGDQDAINH